MRSVLVPVVCYPGLAPARPVPWTSGPTYYPSRPPTSEDAGLCRPHSSALECSVYKDELESSFSLHWMFIYKDLICSYVCGAALRLPTI